MAVMQDNSASSKPSVTLEFYAAKIAQSTTGTLNTAATNATAGTLNVKEYVMPYAGSVYAIAGALSAVPTAGTLRVDVLINGSLTPFTVDTTVSNALSRTFYETQEARKTYNQFAAGQTIALRYVTDANFAPNTTLDGTFMVYALLENVEL